MQFQKGQSGNPAGRPRGARGKATMLAQTLIEGDVEALVRAAIDLAKKGDMRALRLCLNQLLPSRKHAPVACEFPPIEKPADSVAAMAAITGAVADGDLAPGEAAELAKVIDLYLKAAARSISTDGSRKWNNARQEERQNRIKQHVPSFRVSPEGFTPPC